MLNMKTLVFTAKGEYARFRCAYTTTSALTYMVIHPLAVKGIIGAIMGIDYKDLFEYTKDMKIGIQVLNPVYKDMQSFNLIPQKSSNNSPRFPSRIEFLRNVKYRIFLSCDEEKLEKIKDILISREYNFTPYFGCSEHIAKLDFESMQDSNILDADKIKVDTIIPVKKLLTNEITEEINLYTDKIPIKNDINREYTEYCKIIFSNEGNLYCKDCSIYKVGEYNVYYL